MLRTFKFTFIALLFVAFSANAFVKPIEFKTKSKIHTILVQDKNTDYISLNIAFRGAGAVNDPQNKNGLSFITMQMLQRAEIGGESRHQRIRNFVDLGILSGVSLTVSPDNIYARLKAPKENLDHALLELKKILSFRDFDIKDLNNLKSYAPVNSQINKSRETSFASRTLTKKIFAGHPYANPVNGEHNDIQSITKLDLINYLNNSIAKDNMIISVVGDINQKSLSKKIDKYFNFLPKAAKVKKASIPVANADGKVVNIYKLSPQSGVSFMQSGLKFTDKDYYALTAVLDILISEPFTSRLWKQAREEKGLVYDIGATVSTKYDNIGLIKGWFKCDNKDTYQVIKLIRKEWKNIKDNGISKDEYESAITSLVGSYALNFTNPEGISSYLLFIKLKGLDLDFINKRNQIIKNLTLVDLNNAANKYLTPDKLSFVVIGDVN